MKGRLFICTAVKGQDFSTWHSTTPSTTPGPKEHRKLPPHTSALCHPPVLDTPLLVQTASPQCQPRAATGHGSTALLPAALPLLGLHPKMSSGHRADEHFCRKHLPEGLGLAPGRGLHLSVLPAYFVHGTRKHPALKIHTFSSSISASTAGNHVCYLSSKRREKWFPTQITFVNQAAEYFIASAISESYCRAQKEHQCQ